MSSRFALGVAVALSWTIVVPAAALGQEVDPAIESEVRAAVEAFDVALRNGDAEAVLGMLHPAVRIFEGGHAETRDEYASGHLSSDMEFAASVERRTLRDQVIHREDVAVYLSEYSVTGEFRGREIDLHGTETIVLVATPEGWRILHIHWSSR